MVMLSLSSVMLSRWPRAITGFFCLAVVVYGAIASPQEAQAVASAEAIRTCRSCIERCTSTPGGAPSSEATCFETCALPAQERACAGVTSVEANVRDAGASTATPPAGGARAPSTGATVTEGSCQFNCQPPAATASPQVCVADTDCMAPCQRICGSSFAAGQGQCVTTGPAAVKCSTIAGSPDKQCVFVCSITSSPPRTCNPQGTDALAPARVCGSFCETACQTATGQPAAGGTAGHFCSNASTCLASGSGTPAAGAGTSAPSTQAVGGRSGGTMLQNPLPGISSIADLVGRIIKGILGIIGSLGLLMFVYGGVRWIVSAGEPKEITAARGIVRNATIGLFLIFFAYTLSGLVLGLVDDVAGSATGGNANTQSTTPSVPALATCVQTAVTAGRITQNDARDRTTASWTCRETTEAERAADSTVCVRNGCPRNNATTLCCAPPVPPPPPSAGI